MTTSWILGIGAGWAVLLMVTFLLLRISRPERRIQRLVTTVGLALPQELVPAVAAWLRGEMLATIIGSFAGLLLAGGVLSFTGGQPFEIFWGYTMTIVVGMGIGTTVSVLRRESRRQASSVRYARSVAVTMDDYRSRLTQWAPRIVVALLVVGLLARWILAPSAPAAVPLFLIVYIVVAVATLVVSEVAARRVLERGQPAGSAIELAWDDALKSRALHALTVAPLYLGSYGGIMAVVLQEASGLAGPRYAAGLQAEVAVGIVAVVFAAVVPFVELASQSAQRYLRQLWPEFAAAGSSAPAATANVKAVGPVAP